MKKTDPVILQKFDVFLRVTESDIDNVREQLIINRPVPAAQRLDYLKNNLETRVKELRAMVEELLGTKPEEVRPNAPSLRFFNKVKCVLVEQLGVEDPEVYPTAKLVDDLGADSLDLVEIVMAFEETFDVEIPDEDVEKSNIQTVQEVVDFLFRFLPAKELKKWQ